MTSSRKALITGITGQDGSYLAEHLLSLGYEVHGLVRPVAFEAPSQHIDRLAHILNRISLHPGNNESYPSIFNIITRHDFDECYHLAAQSYVGESFADGFTAMNANIQATHYILEAFRELSPRCRFYFAGSSEMFGNTSEAPQRETTAFRPRSPYGISKVVGFDLARNYREAYDMYCVSGILFNHEGPRRGFEFVTRKITSTVARIKLGLANELRLGNLEARRDWGHAKDYTRAMHLMLQQPEPDDYVVASGESHSVREFCERAFGEVGLDYQKYVVIDERFYRPAEVDQLVGDATKIRALGWQPEYSFEELVKEMVHSDLDAIAHTSDSNIEMKNASASQ
jgi:GDPmannose 4,6-dehydratase